MAIAAARSGHEIVAVLSRSGESRFGPPGSWDHLPEADLLLIAVSDDAIEDVAEELSLVCRSIPVTAHLSGYTPVAALDPFARVGLATGGFHPLQTLPDPERGADALAGSFVGIGGDPAARALLDELAASLRMRPFPLEDAARPGYHAGAAAASNFIITALETAGDMFRASGIEPDVARPLAERAVANIYGDSATQALTGPIVRGDWSTVQGQLAAARGVSDDVGDQYRLLAEATAIRAGRRDDIQKWS